jgi:hypothetical protein
LELELGPGHAEEIGERTIEPKPFGQKRLVEPMMIVQSRS